MTLVRADVRAFGNAGLHMFWSVITDEHVPPTLNDEDGGLVEIGGRFRAEFEATQDFFRDRPDMKALAEKLIVRISYSL
jgi:hypothetical protein